MVPAACGASTGVTMWIITERAVASQPLGITAAAQQAPQEWPTGGKRRAGPVSAGPLVAVAGVDPVNAVSAAVISVILPVVDAGPGMVDDIGAALDANIMTGLRT